MKRLVLRVVLLTLAMAACGGGWIWWRASAWLDQPLAAEGGTKRFEVPKGATFKAVTRQLARAGVIDEPLFFEWHGRLKGAGRNIKAGVYAVDLSMSPRSLLERLEAGTLPPQIKLTVLEGWNRWQIADRLAALGVGSRAQFLARVKRDGLEGRLFPDTYWLDKGTTLDRVIGLLTRRFEQVWAEEIKGRPDAAELGRKGAKRLKLLKLASLVEREARTDRDRRLVARVFLNRLAIPMRLQTDPTCVYGPKLYKKRAHPRYCKDKSSKYSTYVIDGLPPTPIANPGRASIKAALNPESSTRAGKLLYFVAKRDGSREHHFSATYAEHRSAVTRYLKGR